MQNEDYSLIEAQIGYEFNNRMLLQQAFTRKSYTNETHDGDNNEVLEFIGDKVLDLVIVKALSEYYGDVNALARRSVRFVFRRKTYRDKEEFGRKQDAFCSYR